MLQTSPSTSIHCGSGIPPLRYRIKQLTLNYAIKISAQTKHLNHSIIFDEEVLSQFHRTPISTRPVGVRASEILAEIGSSFPDVEHLTFSEKEPWILASPTINFDSTKYQKGTTPNETIKQQFLNSVEVYQPCIIIYTDGSKISGGVGCTMATDGVEYNDSLSALSAINNKSSSDPLITKILNTHHRLFEQSKQIMFLWTPGIRGNELADEAARQATESTITDVPLSLDDAKAALKVRVFDAWQREWKISNNYLKLFKPTIKKWSPPPLTRREQVVLTRLRIGHTFLTHSHLLLGNPPETCRRCEVLLTLNHIFLECSLYMVATVLFSLPNSIKDCLLSSSRIRTTLSFLKAIKLFRKV
nr:unnamed protein product [Callosobruchus analis]